MTFNDIYAVCYKHIKKCSVQKTSTKERILLAIKKAHKK